MSVMLCLAALPLAAQSAQPAAHAASAIDPGMTREQVVATLGEPLAAKSYDRFTYLLYKNGCEKTCGMNDLVVLDSGKVVDAVFRSPARHYTGTSSSPTMISPTVAAKGGPTAPMKVPPAAPKKPGS